MTTTATASKPTTTRRRGRPKSDNPKVNRKQTFLTDAETRRMNVMMRKRGITVDNELLRTIILRALDAEGIEDPGPDSEEGLPPVASTRKKRAAAIPAQKTSAQMELAVP